MRISDWSSDVCSSDLQGPVPGQEGQRRLRLEHAYRAVAGQHQGSAQPADRTSRRRHELPANQPGANPRRTSPPAPAVYRKGAVMGMSVPVHVAFGGPLNIKNKIIETALLSTTQSMEPRHKRHGSDHIH